MESQHTTPALTSDWSPPPQFFLDHAGGDSHPPNSQRNWPSFLSFGSFGRSNSEPSARHRVVVVVKPGYNGAQHHHDAFHEHHPRVESYLTPAASRASIDVGGGASGGASNRSNNLIGGGGHKPRDSISTTRPRAQSLMKGGAGGGGGGGGASMARTMSQVFGISVDENRIQKSLKEKKQSAAAAVIVVKKSSTPGITLDTLLRADSSSQDEDRRYSSISTFLDPVLLRPQSSSTTARDDESLSEMQSCIGRENGNRESDSPTPSSVYMNLLVETRAFE